MGSSIGFPQRRLKLAIPTIMRLFHAENNTARIEQHQITIKNFVMDMSVHLDPKGEDSDTAEIV